VAVAAGWVHSLALRADGTVAAWGNNDYGQTDVPPGLSHVVAIAAGDSHSLALKADGTVVVWGWNGEGEADVPAGLSNVVAVAGGYEHCLALQADGTVVAWGWNGEGETNVPVEMSDAMAIAGGAAHSLALVNAGAPVFLKHPAGVTVDAGATVVLNVGAVGVRPLNYRWQKNGVKLNDGGNVSGTTTSSLVLGNVQEPDAAAYRAVARNAAGCIASTPAAVNVRIVRLRLEHDGNDLSIFWPIEPADAVLETSPTLSSSAWAPVPGVPVQVGNELMVRVQMTGSSGFYRLRFNGL
jgi:hypothetical protein